MKMKKNKVPINQTAKAVDIEKKVELTEFNESISIGDNEGIIETIQDLGENISSVVSEGDIFIKEDNIEMSKQGNEVLEPVCYEISYLREDDKVCSYFTKTTPFVIQANLIIKNMFQKGILEENILGQKTLTLSYKELCDESYKEIDLSKDVMIKSVKEEKWMEFLKSNAEKAFERKVLDYYREVNKKIIKGEN